MDAVVQLTDVVRRYRKVRALDGLTLRVEAGALYGFLGRNGAGKTTAPRILMGILRPNSGEVRLFDEAVRKVAGLSGGTRTKLGLCLSLAPRPDLLLLDEPTSGLDQGEP